MQWTLHPATDDDLPELAAMVHAVIDSAYVFADDAERDALVEYLLGDCRMYLADPHARLLVIRDRQQQLIACGALAWTEVVAYLAAGYCLHPGQGIGSALVEARLQVAREHDVKFVFGEIFTENTQGRAHLLRHGFQDTGQRRASVVIGSSPVELWCRAIHSD